ncbi:hypothetical protein PHJA_002111000 [Phtheirospermum japonicum]|uniref:Uncharacterized protein n=1 Tax=Phtheirospermum japonicum TaxID=374723 RepID=A0A830CL05_9LAMI|nr:hypothetical protein PHJA_002111000 [Phtheirospermum japonicum]
MDDDETWQHGESCWPIRGCSEQNYERFVSKDATAVRRSEPSIWTLLWRRIKKQKKKIMFRGSKSTGFNYDPCSYSHNFDQGLMWANPDDLTRSFSARFAAIPSTKD